MADLPSHADWERWFPADWVTEMREQIRLWFYSMLFMSVALVGESPYRRVLTHEKVNDETGRPMHKSWGNAIWFDDAVEEMGADVMRWMYAGQTPSQNLNFGYGPATRSSGRLLKLWNSYAFFVLYANIDGFTPSLRDPDRGAENRPRIRPLDGRGHPAPGGRVEGSARRLRLAAPGAGLRAVHGRPVQLVRADLARPLLAVAATTTTSGPRTRRSGTRSCRHRAASRR